MTPQEIFDAAVNHRLDLDAYSNEQAREITRLVQAVHVRAVERLAAARIALEDGSGTQAAVTQIEGLISELEAVFAQGYRRVSDEIEDQIEALAEIERDFSLNTANSLARAAGVESLTVGPTVAQIVAAVNSVPLNGRFLAPIVEGLEAAAFERVAQEIRIGFVGGESLSELTERVIEAGGVSSRAADIVVRTANTHIAAVAAGETYRLHGAVDRVEYVAVLDSRTTSICRGLDGQVFPVGEGPRPPQHLRCRSVVIPLLIGEDPPERQRYEDWLRSQPPARIEEILGPTRAALFSYGGLSLTDLNGTGGRLLRLDELRARSAAAFRRAEIVPPADAVNTGPLSPEQEVEITRRQEAVVARLLGNSGLERSRVRRVTGEIFAQLVRAVPIDGDRTILNSYTTNLARPGERTPLWRELNRMLRRSPGELDSVQRDLLDYAAALQSALSRARPVPGVSWRGISARPEILAEYQSWQPGEIRKFPEFLSTSVRRNIARQFSNDSSDGRLPIMIRIEGRSGRDLRFFADEFTEAEVLFPSATRFRVISVEIDPAGATRISIEEVDNG